MNIKNYNFGETQVTAIVNDGNYIWYSFLGVAGESILRKVSAYDITQVLYELTLSVDKIVKLKISGSYLYVIVEDDTILLYRYTKVNPLTSPSTVNIPVGINEYPIDLTLIGTDLFILFPGSLSGENAKIVKYNSSLVFQVTIDMNEVGKVSNDAKAIVTDATNLWIITYESPAKLIKVYGSGFSWNYNYWTIL